MQRNDHNSTHQRNAFSSQNALANLPGFNAEVVFTNSIVEAAQNAGCEFLFEIPASLFGFEETRAAAVRLNTFENDDQLAFILCNKNTGQIHVLSNDETPIRVRQFVKSYANVLSFFKTSEVTSH